MSTEKICLIILTDGSVQPPGIAVGNYTGYVYEADPIGHRSDLQIPRTPTGMLYNVFDLYISFGICIVFQKTEKYMRNDNQIRNTLKK